MLADGKRRDLVRTAVDSLCKVYGETADAMAGEVFVGRDLVVVQLVRPVVIAGQCYEVAPTIDIMELIRVAEERNRER